MSVEYIDGYIPLNRLNGLVDNKLHDLGYTYDDYPIRAKDIIERHYKGIIEIRYADFESFDICGILVKGQSGARICLNNLRSQKGQNFDLMHELFHYWFHPKPENFCVDKIACQGGIEWQANSGAAQALMPVHLFIKKYMAFDGDVSKLSDFFFVGEQAVNYRIQNITKYFKLLACNAENMVI